MFRRIFVCLQQSRVDSILNICLRLLAEVRREDYVHHKSYKRARARLFSFVLVEEIERIAET
jgi:hypothetical protein